MNKIGSLGVTVLLFCFLFLSSGFSSERDAGLSYEKLNDLCRKEKFETNEVYSGIFFPIRIFPRSGKLASYCDPGSVIMMVEKKPENQKLFLLFNSTYSEVAKEIGEKYSDFKIEYITGIMQGKFPVVEVKKVYFEN